MSTGVIGLGFMGATHLTALANIPGAQLAAVMDVDEMRLSGDLSGTQGDIGGPAMELPAVRWSPKPKGRTGPDGGAGPFRASVPGAPRIHARTRASICSACPSRSRRPPPALYRANRQSETPVLSEKDFYQVEVEYFLACCRAGVKPAMCPPEESARSVKLALRMLESRR